MIPFALAQTAADGAATEALEESWRLLEVPAAWVVVLVLLPAVALVAGLAYWRQNLRPGTRAALTTLRFLSLVLLLVVLFRPVKVHQQQSVQAPEVLVLFDDSASMSRRDAYAGDDENAEALRALVGTDPAERTRLDLARTAVARELVPRLEDRGYVPRTFRFTDTVSPLADPARLEARGHATHVGTAIQEALAAHRGRHVTDVVLVTDGRSNGGVPAGDAAAAASAAGVPVHSLVVGDARPERNLAVELIDAPEAVLEGDEVVVAARVNASGVEGGAAELVLEEVPVDRRGEPRVVASERVRLAEAGDRVVLVAPKEGLELGATERRFRLSVDPLEDERRTDDNTVVATVRVNRERIRVLYVEGYPRYEYRFLNWMLTRADERIEIQLYLLSASKEFPQDRSRGLPPLTRVPTSREELLENYDVVILGDVNPYLVSPDPAEGERFVQSLTEFVERGGGLCVIAGEFDMPKAIAGSDFAKLLPVELERGGVAALDVDTSREHGYTLENPAAPHPIVRLEPEVEANRRLWEESGGLRGYLWYYPVLGAKPGAQVLLRHPGPSLVNSEERDPLLVLGYYPSGRTMFLAFDATHRWQYRYRDRYLERFWRNALRWLALGRLKSGDRRFELEPLRTEYDLDERVTLEARVLDTDLRPLEEADREIWVSPDDGPPEPVVLGAVPGRPGIYRGTWEAERPGRYRAWIEDGGRRAVTTEFDVVLPSRENADPTPDPAALAEVAALSRGRAVPVARAAELASEFPGDEERREPLSSRLEDAWDHWGTLLAALALLSVEWILRKRAELV